MDTLLYIISRIILLQFLIKVNIFYRNYGITVLFLSGDLYLKAVFWDPLLQTLPV